jgi:hypothetical protein
MRRWLGSSPGLIVPDDRPGAPEGYFYWAVDAGQVGQVLHAYESTWLSQRLLDRGRRPALVDALTRASQNWPVALHCNKGLAGAPANVLGWTRATAMNPAVLDAFALAIAGANEAPAYPRHRRPRAGPRTGTPRRQRRRRRHGAAQGPRQATRLLPVAWVPQFVGTRLWSLEGCRRSAG